jgi:hypothetical protein
MSTSNPFEPPRTTDLDGGAITPPGHLFVSDPALQELADAAPWVRWLTRLTSLSIAVSIVRTIARVVAKGTSGNAGFLFSLALGTAITIMILRVLRRYAAASDRLRAGDRSATDQVIEAQASYFKLAGVLVAIGTGLLILLFVVGVAIGILRR